MKTLIAAMTALTFLASTSSLVFAADDKKNSQQDRMKACNAQAGDKKGDDRKTFMSDCLKADKKT